MYFQDPVMLQQKPAESCFQGETHHISVKDLKIMKSKVTNRDESPNARDSIPTGGEKGSHDAYE